MPVQRLSAVVAGPHCNTCTTNGPLRLPSTSTGCQLVFRAESIADTIAEHLHMMLQGWQTALGTHIRAILVEDLDPTVSRKEKADGRHPANLAKSGPIPREANI